MFGKCEFVCVCLADVLVIYVLCNFVGDLTIAKKVFNPILVNCVAQLAWL